MPLREIATAKLRVETEQKRFFAMPLLRPRIGKTKMRGGKSLKELQRAFAVSHHAVWVCLRQLGFTLKKTHKIPRQPLPFYRQYVPILLLIAIRRHFRLCSVKVVCIPVLQLLDFVIGDKDLRVSMAALVDLVLGGFP
jgi:hypothetical protein